MDELNQLDDIAQVTEAGAVPCMFLTGNAGSGKTFEILRRASEDASYALLMATTGIAAVNIGATTINSILKYFDTASMRDAYLSGFLARTLHDIAKEYRWLAVDEVSMMDGAQLDILFRAVEDANRYSDVDTPLGILLVGDFAQLPPIKAKWAFEADCWEHFARATTRLTKVWRQGEGPFLSALNAARRGEGGLAAEHLASTGFTWHTALHTEFDGTTILPKNDMVNRYNALALARVPGRKFTVKARRWGAQRKEWGENARTHEWGIPRESEFKIGAYVMVLANDSEFAYVNGDCGHVREHTEAYVAVELLRTKKVEFIPPIVRSVEFRERPDDWSGDEGWIDGYHARPHLRKQSGRRRYVTGQIEYTPLRLAYASTVHKSQGLSLDKVQVDCRDSFFGHPSMMYTALSRVRTMEGLRLVGQRERFVQQIKCDPKIRSYL